MGYKTPYHSLLKQNESKYEIKKSIFIARGFPVESEEEAQAIIAEIKAEERSATHHCSAYIIGLNSEVQRFFDDGEPSGTAGIPILEVMKKEEITNALIVVTRYFGGVKLGAAGLIRAYTQGAVEAIKSSVKVKMKTFYELQLDYDYGLHGKVENRLMQEEIIIKDQAFTTSVQLILLIDGERYEEFVAMMMDLTSGTAEMACLEAIYIPTVDNKPVVESWT